MKITTWNVNGLRAVLSKGALSWIKDLQPDVLCLQEIKANREQLEEGQFRETYGLFLADYHALWHSAGRPGYSGVATFTRQEPEHFQFGLAETRFDIEGRVLLTRHPGFLLFNVYFPNGQRANGRLTYKLDFYARFLELCDQLHAGGENIIICGDFNTAHREIDLRNPKQNVAISGFLPEERMWIDHYLEHGFVDAYRSLYPERVQYTWWTYRMGARQRNIGWRLDYYLVSKALMPRVEEVFVHENIFGSDHCPVTLFLQD